MFRSRSLSGGLALTLLLALACGKNKAKAPEWVMTAPVSTVMAVSGEARWGLEHSQFQGLLERFPLAEQTLELFLKRAKISPHQETGRVTLYLLASQAGQARGGGPAVEAGDFLLQLGGFKDPAALNLAINDAFPPEGSLPVEGRELPLYVVMDVNSFHVRVLVDGDGRVWIGDLGALTKLGAGRISARGPIVDSAQWINGGAPFQGFLKPKGLMDEVRSQLPSDWARGLPQGIESMAWSVTPGTGPGATHRFELAITGTPASMLEVAPWLQRFVAAATALPGASSQAPEILQESKRIGLRAQLTQEQVNAALSKLNQPSLALGTFAGSRRP